MTNSELAQPKNTWLHSVPVLIAAGVGLIYGFGALTIYGQIKGEGLNAVQSMGLIPIDQILSRGIGSIVSEFGQMLVAMLIAMPVVWFAPPSTAGKSLSFRSNWPFVAIIAVLFLVLAVSSPMKEALLVAIAILVAAGSVAAMLRVIKRRGERGAAAVSLVALVAGIATILSLNIGNAFLRPAPLPAIELTLRDHASRAGGLITTSDGFWYLAEADGEIESVSSREVIASHLTYPKRGPEQSVLDWILDRPPTTLGGVERKE